MRVRLPAVGAVLAIVAQHEHETGWYGRFRHVVLGRGRIANIDVWFSDRLALYHHVSARDRDRVATQRDDTLDEGHARLPGIGVGGDLSARRRVGAVISRVDQQRVANAQRRIHAGRGYLIVARAGHAGGNYRRQRRRDDRGGREDHHRNIPSTLALAR